MNEKPLKTYNPRERRCAVCNALIITRIPGKYQFQIRRKGSPTLFFCKDSHYEKWKAEHPVQDRRRKDG